MRAVVGAFVLALGAREIQAQDPQQLAGCYLFNASLFEWFVFNPVARTGHADSSRLIELTDAPVTRLRYADSRVRVHAFQVRIPALTDSGVIDRYARASYWATGSADTIHVAWSDALHGWFLRLTPSRDTLRGYATEISDLGGRRRRDGLQAVAMACPR